MKKKTVTELLLYQSKFIKPLKTIKNCSEQFRIPAHFLSFSVFPLSRDVPFVTRLFQKMFSDASSSKSNAWENQ